MLDEIGSSIDEVDPSRGPVVDLFSGSGVVAASLARARSVTAVDIQEYARVLSSALLSPARLSNVATMRLTAAAVSMANELAETVLRGLLSWERAAVEALEASDPEPLCGIIERGSFAALDVAEGPLEDSLVHTLSEVAPQLGEIGVPLTLTRYYGGVYFGYRQALQLDCLLAVVRMIPQEAHRDTALAAVLGAASDSVTSVGSHFAQPLRPRDQQGRPKIHALRTLARRRQRDVCAIFLERLRRYAEAPGTGHAAQAVCSDYRDFLASHRADISVVYADPPYTRDHYSRFYHVLETIARGDTPQISTVTSAGRTSLSRGLYRLERHQSPFCIRSEVLEAFRSLFVAVGRFNAPLVLSYSPYSSGTAARPKPRLMTIQELVDLALETFDGVFVRSAGQLRHSKLNADRLNGTHHPEAELFLICTP